VELPLESVPNVSEGRDREAIDAIAAAFGRRARLLDVHSDPDHHRSVFTLVAAEDDLVEAVLDGFLAARARIDLRGHEGVHPRVGALDVVPIVPLRPADMDRARRTALAAAARIGQAGVPVFLYAESGGGRRPAFFRRGGPSALQRRVEAGELAPDFGPSRLDPAAGAALVGARPPLVAFNVDLETADVEVARAVAAAVRESGGGLPGVRALGLALPRSGRIQVSMNVESLERTALHVAVAQVVAEAAARGVAAGRAELVGLLPASAVVAAAEPMLRLEGLGPERVLELRLLEPGP
jgi:glutamate formiminotransferase